ncbi:MAG: adenylate kinase family protein [Candidatus Paceibacterota bacterium]
MEKVKKKDTYTFSFFGRSGAGKGIQSGKMKEYLNERYPEKKTLYIETGQLFRDFIKNNQSYSRDIVKSVLDEGGLLPAFLPIWMWSEFLVKKFSGDENLIFDGVARRYVEAPVFEEALAFYNCSKPFIVYIDVSPECAMERLKKRGRHDDVEEKIQERLDWYEENVMPAIDFFRESKNVRFVSINGDQSPENVHKDIVKNTLDSQ